MVTSRQDLLTLIEWSVDHLQGQWTFGVSNLDHIFYIENASDALLFKLTWGRSG